MDAEELPQWLLTSKVLPPWIVDGKLLEGIKR
jgi:hypothetical protein